MLWGLCAGYWALEPYITILLYIIHIWVLLKGQHHWECSQPHLSLLGFHASFWLDTYSHFLSLTNFATPDGLPCWSNNIPCFQAVAPKQLWPSSWRTCQPGWFQILQFLVFNKFKKNQKGSTRNIILVRRENDKSLSSSIFLINTHVKHIWPCWQELSPTSHHTNSMHTSQLSWLPNMEGWPVLKTMPFQECAGC